MMEVTPELHDAIVRIVDQRVAEIKVTREDFDRLTKTMAELAERVKELAEAQKRTEFTLATHGEAITRLEKAVENLAEAQKRTEERIGELSDAVKGLAIAVGRLTDTVGYGLEDVAMVMLPPWLEKHEHIKVEALERRFLQAEGESVEVNLYGEGVRGRRPILVIGEAKSKIHPADVREFAGNLEKIRKSLRGPNLLPLMFGYWIHPAATSLARTLRIRLIASYQR